MKTDIKKSKLLSLILRHKPETVGVELDENGWINIDTLLKALADHNKDLTHDELLKIVQDNDKQRFAISEDGLRIRANQGHSVAVDLDLAPSVPPECLYHGTVAKFYEAIMREGLKKGQRHHVHLSKDLTTASKVGQRRGKPIILEVESGRMQRDGYQFYQTKNEVWLVDAVPTQYISLKD